MQFNEREVLLLYKQGIKKDKNAYHMAKQVSEHVNDIDVIKTPLTETQLREILLRLNTPIEQMIERDSDVFKKEYKDVDLDEDGWIKAMAKNPDLIKTPIAFKGKRGMIVQTPSNILELDPKQGYNDLTQ